MFGQRHKEERRENFIVSKSQISACWSLLIQESLDRELFEVGSPMGWSEVYIWLSLPDPNLKTKVKMNKSVSYWPCPCLMGLI